MAKPEEFTLKAALRLTTFGDTVGIPLFAGGSQNFLWWVETDDFLRIRRFQPFTREMSGVEWLDDVDDRASFRVGDYAPLPLWIGNERRMVPGAVSPSELGMDFSEDATRRPVMRRLAAMLSRARLKELAGKQEPESFWQSYRFLSQNFSGGAGWINRLSAVIRQMDAYFHSDAPEREDLVSRIWQWIDTYIKNINLERFEYFVETLRLLPESCREKDVLLNVSVLEGMLSGGRKFALFESLERLGIPNGKEALAALMSYADTSERARRVALTFEIRLSAEIEHRFGLMERDLFGVYDNIEDVAALVEHFGYVPVSNYVRFRIPVVIKSYFDQMRLVEEKIRSQDGQVGDGETEELTRQFEWLFYLARTLARVGGGEKGVEAMERAYARGV